MEIDFFNILAYFIIYSVFGWILESIFRSICEKKVINTGFLIGSVCPIYGLGAIIMLATMGQLHGKIIEIFIISVTLLTLWEYIVGVLLEKIFKTKYWDYSDHKINFQGRICLTNSLAWGVLGVVFINYVHPFVVSLINYMELNVFKSVIYGAFAVMIVDCIISIIKIKNVKFKLEKVQELNDEIKTKLKEIRAHNKTYDKSKDTLKELKIKRNRMMRRLYRYVYRIKNAFPAINTKEFTEILNKKYKIPRKNSKDKRRK